jgi:ATP-dependent DNA ligase
VVDGEIIVPSSAHSGLDFDALLQRVHPAESRVRLLSVETPALLVLFDVLSVGDQDLMSRPFSERREVLSSLVTPGGPISITAQTSSLDVATQWFSQFEGAGLDGVVAKDPAGLYEPGKRTMQKIKHERTADCVVAGYRPHKSGDDAVGSLLLGLYNDDGVLASVGVAASFPMARRRELVTELAPLVVPLDGHPWDFSAVGRTPREAAGSRWSAGKDLSFVPLEPSLVVEVAYDHMEGDRFRHTAQFRRWRPDRSPESCTYAQLERPVRFALADIVPGLVSRGGEEGAQPVR